LNLREMYSLTGTLLGDPSNTAIERSQLLEYLNRGQDVVAGHLFSINKDMFLTTNTQAAVGAQTSYSLPANCRDVVRVTYNSIECTRLSVADLAALDRNTMMRPVKGFSQWYTLEAGTVGKYKITLYPTPDDTSNIKVWYYQKPIKFHELGTYDGTVTTSTSATQFTDTAAPFAGTTGSGMATFWVDATFRPKTGAAKNQTVRVVSWTPATGVFVIETLTDAPGTVAYELDQVCIVPDQYHHLVCFYGSYLANQGVGKDSPWMVQFEKELFQFEREKWLNNVEAALPGEVAKAVSRGRTS
jgi:hypothetical protein